MPKIGDVLYRVEVVPYSECKSLALKRGWKEDDDNMLDYADEGDVTYHLEYKNFTSARRSAKRVLNDQMYGSTIIEQVKYVDEYDDGYPSWEIVAQWEVTCDETRILKYER
jgi:hypothetical protein